MTQDEVKVLRHSEGVHSISGTQGEQETPDKHGATASSSPPYSMTPSKPFEDSLSGEVVENFAAGKSAVDETDNCVENDATDKERTSVMESDQNVLPLRQIHAKDLQHSEQKLYWFLVGWLGGPPLYEKQFGHPRLRQRHMPFAIDQSMVSQWLYCMAKALDQWVPDPKDNALIYSQLSSLAQHMINRPENRSANPEG